MSLATTTDHHLNWRMIFTPDRSVLYVAVPKTGCTTIKTLMAGAVGLIDPASDDFGSASQNIHILWGRRKGRWSALKPRKQDAMLNDAWTFRFTSVRDPFERIVSCYLSKVVREVSRNPLRRQMIERGDMSLLGFLRFVHDQAPLERDKHCQRQTDLCFAGEITYDFLVRHETFAADLQTIIERLNVPGLRIPTQDLEKATEAKTLTDTLLGPEERALVGEIYAADFEAFGYSAA